MENFHSNKRSSCSQMVFFVCCMDVVICTVRSKAYFSYRECFCIHCNRYIVLKCLFKTISCVDKWRLKSIVCLRLLLVLCISVHIAVLSYIAYLAIFNDVMTHIFRHHAYFSFYVRLYSLREHSRKIYVIFIECCNRTLQLEIGNMRKRSIASFCVCV